MECSYNLMKNWIGIETGRVKNIGNRSAMDLNISRFHRADRPRDFPDYVYFTIGTWAAGMRLHGFAGRVERVVKESSHRLEFCGEILDDMELQLERWNWREKSEEWTRKRAQRGCELKERRCLWTDDAGKMKKKKRKRERRNRICGNENRNLEELRGSK